MSHPNVASDVRALIERFYSRVLTHGCDQLEAEAKQILAEDWTSIGSYRGPAKDRVAFVKQVAGFMRLIPDLSWKIEEILAVNDKIVVRSRASGSPEGPFFGVEPGGRSFEIMTIDVHTVQGGKIVQTYHVEDWAGAIGQLRGA